MKLHVVEIEKGHPGLRKDTPGNFTREEMDEIASRFNCHDKLAKALKENYEYTKYAGANKRINTEDYMEEFFKKGLSAQQSAKQALKEKP